MHSVNSSDCAPIASVLIVDDSIVQLNHAASLCRQLGVQTIHTAGNGSEAIALLEGRIAPPSLLILDLEMPMLDGAQTLELLQQRGMDIPVLMVSTRELTLLEMVSDLGLALGLRIIGVLQKPLSLEKLRGALAADIPAPIVPKELLPARVTADELAAALRSGDVHAFYQPKVHVRSARMCGVEALARWRHPTKGAIHPAEFLPLAEESGLISELTHLVIEKAMMQSSFWMAHGLHVSMAINLSAALLTDASLPAFICDLQQSFAIPTDKITFEITESCLVSRQSSALGVLARLRLKGFGLSIDDYGTGFSSMQQLSRIPFTELKIDRSFVANAHQNDKRHVILRSAIEMAEELGVQSVAEGVETLTEWRMLQDLGCTVAQGYFIAKPMPGDQMIHWVKDYLQRMPGLRQEGGNEPAEADPSSSRAADGI